MARVKLNEDSTLKDLHKLSDPVEYVRNVLHNMNDYRKTHEGSYVRIGITGRGILPNYRLEPESCEESLFITFRGGNHKQIDWSTSDLQQEHWSTARLSFDEVQQFIGQLRALKQ